MKLFITILFFTFTILNLYLPQKTSAISDSLVIYQLQTSGVTATQEFVLIYNLSAIDVNVSNWCIEYSSAASDNLGFKSCVETDANTELWLSSGGMLSFATSEFLTANPSFIADVVMSSGMAATGGHLRLKNSSGIEIDKVGWGGAINPEGLGVSAHVSGQVLSRNLSLLNIDTDVNSVDFVSTNIHSPVITGLYEVEIEIDECLNIEETIVPEGYLQDENGNCYFDICPNLEGLQITVPKGYGIPAGVGNCEEVPKENRVLFITELLPNPPSYDTDAEFIELYNPNNQQIGLSGFRIQVGPSFTKEFIFTEGFILPNEYLIFNDGLTGITLPNSSGVKLRLVAPAGNVVSETDVYSNAGDDVSWALVDDQWIYTNQITPDGPNKPYLEITVNEVEGSTTVYAPCPAGKYRSTETNRCRNIETAVSQLTPCDADEYRNPETNRCRKLSSSTSSLKPCEADEERNPDTNRCRKVSVLGITDQDDLAEVVDVETQSTEGNINWGIITLAVLGTAGYMLFEWRTEIQRKINGFIN